MGSPIAYVGAGMSTAPKDTLDLMEDAAQMLAAEGVHLRTGCGQGPCEAFVRGAKDPSLYSIFLPALTWGNLSVNQPSVYAAYDKHLANFEYATNYGRKFYPDWVGQAGTVQFMMAMVSYQVLGKDLLDPAGFVLCWTPDGIGRDTTAQVIRLAQAHSIPIFDLGIMDPLAAGEAIIELLEQQRYWYPRQTGQHREL